MPQVSVIIATYNMAATLGRAIDSVLAQTLADYELICVDDGSTDDTAAVLGRYRDRARIVVQKNQGESGARNSGVRHSCGEYLAFLDADDAWRPDRLERTVAELDAHPGCVLVCSGIITLDATGKQEAGTDFHATSDAVDGASLEEMLAGKGPHVVVPSTWLLRRWAFEQAGGFREDVRSWEDTEMVLRLREVGPFRYIPEPLVIYAERSRAGFFEKWNARDAAARHFMEVVRQRYGRRADGLIARWSSWRVNLLSHGGLLALAQGDRAGARRCLVTALWWNPYRMKTYLRLARTFMPLRVAAALSGRAGAQARQALRAG